MEINSVEIPPAEQINLKVEQQLRKLKKMIDELRTKNLQHVSIEFINDIIQKLYQLDFNSKTSRYKIGQFKREILNYLQKNEGMFAKGHFTALYMTVGMSAIGLPLGVVFGFAVDNLGLLGVGLPIGLALGLALGRKKDMRIKQEGKQLIDAI